MNWLLLVGILVTGIGLAMIHPGLNVMAIGIILMIVSNKPSA